MNKTFRFFSVCALLSMMSASSVLAVPAKPVKKSFVRKDGQSVELTLVGDEYLHFYQDADGNALRMVADNQFEEMAADELEQILKKEEKQES